MRKALKIPNGKIKPKEAGMSSLMHGSGPSLLPGSIPSRASHQRAPLQRKMLVLPGGIGMLARQNVRYPKSSKVMALAPRFPIPPALVVMPGVTDLPLL